MPFRDCRHWMTGSALTKRQPPFAPTEQPTFARVYVGYLDLGAEHGWNYSLSSGSGHFQSFPLEILPAAVPQ